MPSRDPKYDVGRVVRVGVIAVSFAALTAVLGGVTAGGGDDTGGGADLSTIGRLGGTEGFDIASAFQTLSRLQQARVMQRCREVVARPAQADANQITICQTLMAMAKR